MVENSTLGWIGIVTAVLFFGSYGVPIKLVKTGDGVFFQWVECVAILIVGYICQFTTAAFNFYPLATIGGVLWCLGNVTMVPIVNLIGLSLGLLLWSLINMLTGWFAGHFGWFVEAESVPRPVLNYLGVIIAALSAFFYLPVKPTLRDEAKQNDDHILEESTPLNVNTDFTTSPRLSPMARKIIGIALSVLAGIFYGVNMLPVKHLQDQNPSHGPLEYAFSHFTGIFFCSTAVLVLYSIYQRSLPFVNPRSILAGITAGTRDSLLEFFELKTHILSDLSFFRNAMGYCAIGIFCCQCLFGSHHSVSDYWNWPRSNSNILGCCGLQRNPRQKELPLVGSSNHFNSRRHHFNHTLSYLM
jgi:hypothetical protein